jgi:pyruvate,water dikinase
MDKKEELEFLLEGIIAYPGYVRGKARIYNSLYQEKNDLLEPYILVSKYTTPDMIFLMYKAIGIITDIGGITSHAAIISRELGIPCITATGRATEIIRDGDEIVLDAREGFQKYGKIYRKRVI